MVCAFGCCSPPALRQFRRVFPIEGDAGRTQPDSARGEKLSLAASLATPVLDGNEAVLDRLRRSPAKRIGRTFSGKERVAPDRRQSVVVLHQRGEAVTGSASKAARNPANQTSFQPRNAHTPSTVSNRCS